ncbi:MAG: alpha/beta hydrolase [Nannocystaceae bacterium]
MPLDRRLRALLWIGERLGGDLPVARITPTLARREFTATMRKLRLLAIGRPPRLAEVRDLTIPVDDAAIPARLYRPRGVTTPPIVVYFHGGGWVIGSVNDYDPFVRRLAAELGAIVVAVDYRCAPERPHPTAAEDCYQATRWIAGEAAALGGAPGRLAVAGDSAGGNLSAVVSILARERGGPTIGAQVLYYPVVDDDLDRPSYLENARGLGLTRERMGWYWGCYAPPGVDRRAPSLAPLHADLRGLPPALVITAEYDVLRDEGDDYAAALRAAGVAVEHDRVAGVIHGYALMLRLLPQARATMRRVRGFLERALG